MIDAISKNSFIKEVVKCIDFFFFLTIIYIEDKLNKGNQGPSLCSFDLIQSSLSLWIHNSTYSLYGLHYQQQN